MPRLGCCANALCSPLVYQITTGPLAFTRLPILLYPLFAYSFVEMREQCQDATTFLPKIQEIAKQRELEDTVMMFERYDDEFIEYSTIAPTPRYVSSTPPAACVMNINACLITCCVPVKT